MLSVKSFNKRRNGSAAIDRREMFLRAWEHLPTSEKAPGDTSAPLAQLVRMGNLYENSA